MIMSDVSRPTERRWVGTIAGMGAGIAEIGYDNPVLIGVGNVFEACERDVLRLPADFIAA
jgi:uroporphyrin-III C-methyltransferase/precorrin-2 dehydrogenase/sirohydrochlorin ferrochelatase